MSATPIHAAAATSHGHHWLLDLSDCAAAAEVLELRSPLEALSVQACLDAGMQVLGRAFHQFTPSGVTGLVLLAESHLSVHTWPELRFVALDVYVCDHSRDNRARGQTLVRAMLSALLPGRVSQHLIRRSSVLAPRGGRDSAPATAACSHV